jgi:hypothetical protein
MLYGKAPIRKTAAEVGEEIGNLLDFWAPAFAKLNWPDRLQLLEQIDEEIRRDWRHTPGVVSISEDFTAKLLDRLGRSAILCRDQADFYLNSLNPSDRDAASAWRDQGCSVDGAAAGASPRHDEENERRGAGSGGPVAT